MESKNNKSVRKLLTELALAGSLIIAPKIADAQHRRGPTVSMPRQTMTQRQMTSRGFSQRSFSPRTAMPNMRGVPVQPQLRPGEAGILGNGHRRGETTSINRGIVPNAFRRRHFGGHGGFDAFGYSSYYSGFYGYSSYYGPGFFNFAFGLGLPFIPCNYFGPMSGFYYSRMGRGGYVQNGMSEQEAINLLNESAELRQKFHNLDKEFAEHLAYEKGREDERGGRSAQPEQRVQPEIPEPRAEGPMEFRSRYMGNVASNQYDDFAIELYSAFFASLYNVTNGEKQLVPYDIKGNKVIGIRDNKRISQGDRSTVGIVNLSSYPNCMPSSALIGRLLDDLKKTGVVDYSAFEKAQGNLKVLYDIRFDDACRQ